MRPLSKKILLALGCRLALGCGAGWAAEGEAPAERQTYSVPRASSPITLDGSLDEEAWDSALKVELAYETNPGENVPAPVQTECFVTYDERKLYVAFRAYDPTPAAIRAHLSDRDRAFQDDFVGVVLDTFNDQRRGFEFFVNPLGVQMDLTQDDVSGNEDDSWDAIWESAGRVDNGGYIVELAVPFSSLRFPRVDGEMTWGFDAIRIYPRNQRSRIGLHPLDRNVSCYLCQASKLTGFSGVTPGRNMEFVPTLTTHRSDVRDTDLAKFPDVPFENGPVEADLGVTARWGVTPNLTLNAAVNPDFSQVETDTAQLDTNTTFALFFPEKRPFFLEGADFFQTPLNVVYTRTVADPSVGLKLTGKQGKNALGLFVTADERSNLLLPGSEGSELTALDEDLEEERGTADVVLRYRRDLGKSSTVGLMFTDREGSDYSNRVLGVDGLIRITNSDTLRFQLLGSQTRYPDALAGDFEQPEGTFEDRAMRFSFSHSKRTWNVYGIYEDLGRDFRADLGFLPQVDYRIGIFGGEYIIQGKPTDWYTRIGFGSDVDQTNKQDGPLLEREWEAWLFGGGPKQSWLNLNLGVRKKTFEGLEFDQQFLHAFFEMTPVGSTYFYIEGELADAIDFANTQAGTQKRAWAGVRLRLGRSLQFQVDHAFHQLDVDGGRLFVANLTQARLVYQFNIRMFARAILQYTDIDRNPDLYLQDEVKADTQRLANQLLFSYKLNPQTVLFLGYSDAHFGETGIDLTQTNRTLFLKLGYAWTL
jgi:hypothetical protein